MPKQHAEIKAEESPQKKAEASAQEPTHKMNESCEIKDRNEMTENQNNKGKMEECQEDMEKHGKKKNKKEEEVRKIRDGNPIPGLTEEPTISDRIKEDKETLVPRYQRRSMKQEFMGQYQMLASQER